MNAVLAEPLPLKLDLGCGKNPAEGFLGVDRIAFGKNQVVDLRERWPWDDSTVDEIRSSHMLEHFERRERVHIMNEMWRVMKPKAKAQIIVPWWGSARAYGDMTHCWPPVSEWWPLYLDKNWRDSNAPHDDSRYTPDGYSCDFPHNSAGCVYVLNPNITTRAADVQQWAISYYREAATDLIINLEARKPA